MKYYVKWHCVLALLFKLFNKVDAMYVETYFMFKY